MTAQYDQLGEFYDLAYGSATPAHEQDFALYRRLANETGRTVLEMGSGTGRICVPLAAEGIAVTGLELSSAMVRIAENKAAALSSDQRACLRIINADMSGKLPAELSGESFGLVIFPYSALLELETTDQVSRAVDNARRLLAGSGVLVIDNFHYGPGAAERPDGILRRGKCVNQPGGNVLQFYETDFRSQRGNIIETERWLFADIINDNGLVIEHRLFIIKRMYLAPEQMRTILVQAGFSEQNITLWGSFDGTPFNAPAFTDENSKLYRKARQVWVCRK
ncbi:MAG: class I SAM-dependent methyltransferase [Deltaproteobacteria bacterium]|nr:class I SAM-dependent methyltransferase [Deltaproteobacteria bacterium]